jgi:glycine hydroxymethyltransferase
VLAAALAERGFELVSGVTDNHLILMDLSNRNIGGKPVAQALDRAGLTTNYNTVPYDPRKPFDPSGLRLGTAAATTRGLGAYEMEAVAAWIDRVVRATAAADEVTVEAVRREVSALALAHPLPAL